MLFVIENSFSDEVEAYARGRSKKASREESGVE